ncbi:MAG: hypothetical protein ACKVP9_14675 [Burkholderiales bacterium]|nr:hypothetical protein [Betaproteobacteria bacterium]
MRAVLFVVLSTLLLQGCGRMIDSRFEECEKGAPTFVSMADCQARTARDDAAGINNVVQRARSEARAQRFSQIAEELSEKVAVGRLPEEQARLVLHRVLEELLDAERDDRLAPVRQQTRTMTCSPVGPGGGVSCTQN